MLLLQSSNKKAKIILAPTTKNKNTTNKTKQSLAKIRAKIFILTLILYVFFLFHSHF